MTDGTLPASLDTAVIWPRMIEMRKAIADTMGLDLAVGPYRYFNVPGGGISVHQVYPWIQEGYSGVRSFLTTETDSIGHASRFDRLEQPYGDILGGRSTSSNRWWRVPYTLADPKTPNGRKVTYAVNAMEFVLGSRDTTWGEFITTNAGYNPTFTSNGVCNRLVSFWLRMAAGQGEAFMHGMNLNGHTENGNAIAGLWGSHGYDPSALLEHPHSGCQADDARVDSRQRYGSVTKEARCCSIENPQCGWL